MADPGGWTIESRELEPGSLEHRLLRSGAPATYAEVLAGWAEGREGLLEALSPVLRDATFGAYLWETPPITRATVGRPFTFVRIRSASLARMRPEPETFASHYPGAVDGIVTFANLGGDALLVAPVPDEGPPYPHLAAFSRSAPTRKQASLWRAVGSAAQVELGPQPLWISTSGLGVAWLHVRLDSFPKYYHHDAYRHDPCREA